MKNLRMVQVKKTSGRILGKITEEGLKKSPKKTRKNASQAVIDSDIMTINKSKNDIQDNDEINLNSDFKNKSIKKELSLDKSREIYETNYNFSSDTLEIGATSYFFDRTLEIRNRLRKYFPDIWDVIYVIHLLRLIYEPKFKRLKTHYQYSILSVIFPNINLSSGAIRKTIINIGRQRSLIREFMLEDINKNSIYLLVDGHRLITLSRNRNLAELGYDSKKRYKPQINLIYIFSLDSDCGIPVYYKQYAGSTPDVSGFEDILKDTNLELDDVIAVTDKGFASESDFKLLIESGLQYIIPLKRGNIYVKNKIPQSPVQYDYGFTYNNRTIFFNEVKIDENLDFKIFLYCDISLYKDEINTIMTILEKENKIVINKKEREERLRRKNKGKLSDSELSLLIPKKIEDAFKDKKSIGTITLRVKGKNINGEQAFFIWKTRQAIEQYFKTYDNTLDYDDSFMRDDTTEEGWLFLNHLSAMTAMSSINEINNLNLSKQISFDDIRFKLRKIQADRINDNNWLIKPIKSEVKKLCDKLDIDIECLSSFNGILNICYKSTTKPS